MTSPYNKKSKSKWKEITQGLIDKHPFSKDEIVEVVLDSWKAIFSSKIGKFQIGKEIFPAPQVLSFFLHELVAHNFTLKYPGKFRVGTAKTDKDIHCIYDDDFSVEIKASSNKSQIFANRSYAQPATAGQRKNKDGYFIAVNFEQITKSKPKPDILVIRFGYLEHSDWIAQSAATGQQARLAPETYDLKFLTLYLKK
ncbi:MAG: ScaI family restriction endonuclease [Desulfitobacterium hafniense]|nr:ScaI family restriction endonuclease [Desulfitobacterium hafniense]